MAKPRKPRPEQPHKSKSYIGYDPSKIVDNPQVNNQAVARNSAQKQAADAFDSTDILVLLGPPGTGKTWVAIALAYASLMQKKVSKITVTRPTITCAGEELGFIPGSVEEKMHPFLLPYMDVLRSLVGEAAPKVLATFEVLPLAYIRGRTLSDCVGILDEAQNCTVEQLKAYCTRIGDIPRQGKLIISGDPHQSDLRGGGGNLVAVARCLERQGVATVIEFTNEMIVRSRHIAAILSAFDDLYVQEK